MPQGVGQHHRVPVPCSERLATCARSGTDGPAHVHVEVSSACQASCVYCPAFARTGELLPADRAEAWFVAWAAEGVASVTLHGFGEPLLNPAFAAIVRSAARAGLRYEFATNGAALADHVRDMAPSPPSRIGVSLDSTDPLIAQSLRPGIRHAAVLGGIRRAAEGLAATRIEIWATVTRQTVAGLADLAGLTRDLGADALVLQPVHGPAARTLAPEAEALAAAVSRTAAAADKRGVVLDTRRVRPLPVVSCDYPFSSVYVRAGGAVLPCCNWDPAAPVADLGSSGSLAAIWSGALAQVREDLARGRAPRGCSGCRSLFDGGPR